MKLIVNIPDSYNLDGIRNGSIYSQLVLNAVKNGTPIPDNATNGDVIKVLFKNSLYEEDAETSDNEDYICMHNGLNSVCDFDIKWWNSPYQKGGKK